MKKIFKTSFFLALVAGFFVFQASSPDGRVFDDSNPYIDQPTREYYSNWNAFQYDNSELDVISDASGFDNFNVAVEGAEMLVVSNPQNPLWMFYGVNGGPLYARHSEDGGLTWALRNPTYPSGTCCDPWAAYTGNGVLIFGSLHTGAGQHTYRSTDNGANWFAPVLSVSGNDRNTLAAEQSGTGPFANYVYAAITPGNFSVSTDQGVSWNATYSSANNIPGVMIAVGPNGSTNGGSVIYVTNTGATANVTYTFHLSSDGGQTFTVQSSFNDAGYVGTLNALGRLVINNSRTRPYPMIAFDNSNGTYRGRLYCVYASNEPPGDGNKPDIILRYSTDKGVSWSSRIKVNDDANSQNVDNWFPAVWCDQTTGKLYIKWYDDRENPATYLTGVWATYSTDGGVTFAPNQRVSNTAFLYPCPVCGPNENCYRGDYDGITSNSKVGYAMWYDARGCNYLTMGAFFPDYAMKVRPDTLQMNGVSDSGFVSVKIPAVKLYSDTVQFSAAITPAPSSGSFDISFVDKNNNGLIRNFLTTLPDSVRCRVKTVGGVSTGVYTLRIKSNGPNGTPAHFRNVILSVSPIGIITLGNEIPESYYLYQNFPNPFNPKTNIRFDLVRSGTVKLTVFDVTGRQVAALVNGSQSAGKYVVDFDAANYSSGIYFYRLETSDFVSVKKMMFVK